MTKSTSTENVRIWQPANLDGIEMLRATYVTQRFASHCHRRFAVGVTESGALGFYDE